MSDAPKRNDATKRTATTRASERRARTSGGQQAETLPLLAEQLSVTKRKQETGRVRIATRTKERLALVDEDLAHERVEIETVPVGRRIQSVPDVRREGDTTIFPVVEEVLSVERQLVLKEEVRIRLVRTTERHQEKVALRQQEAVITRQRNTGEAATDSPRSNTSSKRVKVPKTRRG